MGVGLHHARTLYAYNNCDLVWLCDKDKHKLSKVGTEFANVNKTQDDKDIFTDPNIDLICIASYDDSHHQQVIDALKNGKHVFVEKPLCLNEGEALNIRNALKINPNLKISSNMVLRSCPLFLKVREKVREKTMGEIYYLETDYLWGRKEKLTSGWRADANFYSIIHGAAVHMIDLAVWIVGQKPVSVQALGNNITTKRYKTKI